MAATVWQDVCIGLGSNVGDRFGHLEAGVEALRLLPGFDLQSVSGVWETEHVGPGTQEPYLNACLRGRTALVPAVLLSSLKGIERDRGRAPESHGLPRTLDLDLLLYGSARQDDAHPHLPHPGLAERAFVLAPLAEIAGERVLPDSGETVAARCAKIRRKPGPWLRLRKDLRLERVGEAAQEGDGGSVALHRR